MIRHSLFFALVLLFTAVSSCTDTEEPVDGYGTTTPMGGEEVEKYISEIENNDSLRTHSTLSYTKGTAQSYEVKFALNDSNELINVIVMYTSVEGGSVSTQKYYYKNGYKYATKEYFEEGFGESSKFAERVSYYNEKGEVIATKKRSAPYEDYLESEMFTAVEKYDCSDERALTAMQAKGEFATNFKGFVSDGGQRYLIVGENKQGGYESAILVNAYSPTISELVNNEQKYIGKPLDVNFQVVHDAAGYIFQSLLSVSIAE